MDISFYEEKVNITYRESFDKLCKTLLDYNEIVNLTAVTDEKEVFLKHFLDSVVGESFFEKNACVAEIGPGGGFPSLPLKIVRDDLKFVLFESVNKKCIYLNKCVDSFAFKDVKVVNMRAEDASRQQIYREKFDCAVARAVARMNTLCEYCLPLVKVGGVFVAYKGDCDGELEEAEKAIGVLGGKLGTVEKFVLPNGEKRSIITINKVAQTPLKYPRGQGKERKNPIR